MNDEFLKIQLENTQRIIEPEKFKLIKDLVFEKVKMPDGSDISPETVLQAHDKDMRKYIKNLLGSALGEEIEDYFYFPGVTIYEFGKAS